MESNSSPNKNKTIQELADVIIRFAGDSGDGMQLTGSQFTTTSAYIGNDVSTLPDFPAEIRAPAGSLAGVSSFQLNFSRRDIRTPGDQPHVLVAMNPAALLVHQKDVLKGGTIIVNKDAFNERNFQRAGITQDPLTQESLKDFKVIQIPISTLNLNGLKDVDLPTKDKDRCKNFFALGLLYWMYSRPLELTIDWIEKKFKKNPLIVESNIKALKAGFYYGETTEEIPTHFRVKKADLPPGIYRNITGNEALACGLTAAKELSHDQLIYCSYPITPASDVLHELSKLKNFGVKTIQCEDEIAAMGAAIGVAFGGGIGVTGTSGPGLCLKSEAIGLAIMTELPVVILNVQRGGPSTGLPTKTEQADLLQAIYGRNGESPLVVLSCSGPADCFYMAIEAVRIAITHMTPVILLSDGYIANSSEPWLLPDIASLPKITISHPQGPLNEAFMPYDRNPETLARPWALPGTAGYEHRIGGLEKAHRTGNVSYDSMNHEFMVKMRAEKVAKVADYIPDAKVFGEEKGDVLVVGWGGTHGAILTAVERLQQEGHAVSSLHLNYLNPFPKNLGSILNNFNKVIVAELNLGQLAFLLRAKYLVDAIGINKMQGQPFKVQDILDGVTQHLSKKKQVANV